MIGLLIFYILFAAAFCTGFSDDESSIIPSMFLGWFFFPYFLGIAMKAIVIELNNIKKQNK